jgi:hypothetical protein
MPDVGTLLWLLGILLLPLAGWGIRTTLIQRDIHRMLMKLLEMHEHPENTGFGTVGLQGVLGDNTRALKALTHYIKWLETKNGGGKGPPPPIGAD